MITVKSPQDIDKMRLANKITAMALREVANAAAPGLTTRELDSLAETYIRDNGARPAFKGYRGYPCTICSSIDDEVVHGIPSDRVLEPGQILSIDMGVYADGYYGDSAVTVPIGEVDEKKRRLMAVTKHALEMGIAEAVVGNTLYDIAAAIQTETERNGFAIVRQFVGHGIGRELHEAPRVPNHADDAPRLKLREGMTLAIEPMVNAGDYRVRVLEDMWTAVTLDGSPSAHFEHTIAVTNDGPLVLTILPQDE